MGMRNPRGPPLKSPRSRRLSLLYHVLGRTKSLNESQDELRTYPNRSSGELKEDVERDVVR